MPESVDNCVRLRVDAGVGESLAHGICTNLQKQGRLGDDGRIKGSGHNDSPKKKKKK